jgi:V8-like Glu-specific endopeptidase
VAQNVLRVLSATYRRYNEISAVSDEAGVDGSRVDWDAGSARLVWRSVMKEASRVGELRELIGYVAKDQPSLAVTLEELTAATPVEPPPEEEPADGTVQWKGFSDDGGTERQIVEGESTLLDIAFLEVGLDRARAVCRMRVKIGSKWYKGTGFRIGPSQILTNHHVLFSDKDGAEIKASAAEAWFGWELDRDGVPKRPNVVHCDPTTIAGAADRDWGIISASAPIPEDYPALKLPDTEIELTTDDRVYIIQHPGGRPKMIGMHHNIVRSVDDNVVQYWTDTEGGSSGAPVFDKHWNVVALHHRWIAKELANSSEYRNQGQRIDRVLAAMNTAGAWPVEN